MARFKTGDICYSVWFSSYHPSNCKLKTWVVQEETTGTEDKPFYRVQLLRGTTGDTISETRLWPTPLEAIDNCIEECNQYIKNINAGKIKVVGLQSNIKANQSKIATLQTLRIKYAVPTVISGKQFAPNDTPKGSFDSQDEVHLIKRVKGILDDANRHANDAFGLMEKSVKKYWDAGKIIVEELKPLLLEGTTKRGKKKTRPIGLRELCKQVGLTYEWCRQAEHVYKTNPSGFSTDLNIMEFKRRAGILAPKESKPEPKTKPSPATAKKLPAPKPTKLVVHQPEIDEEHEEPTHTVDPEIEEPADTPAIEENEFTTAESLIDDLALYAQQLADNLPDELPVALERKLSAVVSQLIAIEGKLAERRIAK